MNPEHKHHFNKCVECGQEPEFHKFADINEIHVYCPGKCLRLFIRCRSQELAETIWNTANPANVSHATALSENPEIHEWKHGGDPEPETEDEEGNIPTCECCGKKSREPRIDGWIRRGDIWLCSKKCMDDWYEMRLPSKSVPEDPVTNKETADEDKSYWDRQFDLYNLGREIDILRDRVNAADSVAAVASMDNDSTYDVDAFHYINSALSQIRAGLDWIETEVKK